MKVALVIGSCPTGGCGVGDYTMCLANALNASGVETRVITSEGWSLLGVFKVSRSLREQNFDIVHIEYPTVGFGAKLGPQGLALLQSCVVTIHEASQRHILRKLSLFPFAVRPAHIIFTSRFERRFATTWAPWVSRVTSVIPVGSNIGVVANGGPRNLNEILHFGLIAPRRGLEQVLELSGLIKSAKLPLMVRVVGGVPLKHVNYLNKLRSETSELPVIWDLDLSERQVAERLAETSIAYLPYPDGASERRTTLKAALLNGISVVTTRGPQTPRSLAGVVRFCQTAEEALAAICYLVGHREEIARMAATAAHSAQSCTWERIAKLHVRVYRRVLSRRGATETIHNPRVRNGKLA